MLRLIFLLLSFIPSFALYAQQEYITSKLTVKAKIDSTYVFGFNLTESRSAKGGIWNVKTGKAETPLNYTQMKNDTIEGSSVVMLYREVVPGNHPLNRWETWVRKECKWINVEEAENEPKK